MTPEHSLAIDTGIAIAAPPERVWTILTDFTAYPTWNRYMIRVEGRAEAGAALSVTTRDAGSGRETTQSVDVAAATPWRMHWIGEAGAPGTFRGDHLFELTANAGGTALLHFERFSGSAAAAILDAYGTALRANFDLFNRCLKEAAERH